MIVSVAHPEPAPDGGAQLVRRWDPIGDAKGDVVLVHGIAEHSGRYAKIGSWLAEAGYTVTGFDLLGFGASSGGRGDISRWSLYLDQVQGILEGVRTSKRPLVLLGHSLGGLIATDYAVSDRPQPDLLVLSAPALLGGKKWQRAVAPILGRAFPTLAIPNALRGDQLSRDPAVAEAYFSDPLCYFKATTRLGASIFSAQDRATRELARIKIPALVVHGGDDTIVPPEASLPFAAIPGVERRLFPNLRHESFNEPEGPQVMAEVIEWIGAHSH